MTPLTPSLLARLENAVRDESRGELDAALNRYRSVLEHDPDNPEALSLLGRLECRRGNYGEGVLHLQRAARLAPDRADVHLGLGYALIGAGEKRQAVRSFLNALEADANYAPAFVSLGCVFAEHQQHDLAQRAFDFARQSGSEYPEVHYQLGKYYFETNNTEPALAALLNAKRLGGRFDDIEWLLARLYFKQGRYELVLYHLEKTGTSLNDVEVQLIKSTTLIELGRYDEAHDLLQVVLRREPSSTKARLALGRIHLQRDNFVGARRSFQAAIDMDPQAVLAHAGLSEVSAAAGEFGKALEHIKQAGDPDRYDLRTALMYTQLLQRHDQYDEAIKLLNHRLTSRLDHAVGRCRCHLRLGELHESQQNYANAFKHYAQANELKRPLSDVAVADNETRLNFFNRSRLARLRRGAVVLAPQPVFVVGLPGYAVELVKKLLASHPEIALSGHRVTMASLANDLASTLATASTYPEALKQARAAELSRMADQFRAKNFEGGAQAVVDVDSQNADYLGFAGLLFPNLRVVRVTQNTDDLALDMYTREGSLNAIGELNTLPSIYARIRRMDSMMDHWKALQEFPILSLRYENLVARPGENIERLLGFMRIDSHPQVYVQMRKPGPNGDLLSESRSRVNRSLPFKPFMTHQSGESEN
ncbi:MAG: tetratricopeptide repeat protein [Gammaproteobacteria bacterium]